MNTHQLMFFTLVVCATAELAGCSASSSGGGAPTLDAATETATISDAEWEMTGVPNDAGVPPADAPLSCSPPDAATTYGDSGFGCQANSGVYVNGVALCSSSQYGVGCYVGSTPVASLECSQVSTSPTPLGVLYFCCPCVAGD
jgi:hypothetical protein